MGSKPKSVANNFPRRFLWGAATSAHQVEGDLHNDWTVWELENAKSLAVRAAYQYDDLANWSAIRKQAERPQNYISGKAVDHYHRYEEDFTLLKEIGLDTLRFGIEWARVEPEEGVWDEKEIDHYRQYLKTLHTMGITPVVTLQHFTVPVWFRQKGGFAKRSNVRYFVRYAKKILDELGKDISWIITINEPTVLVGQSYMMGDWPPNKTNKLQGVWVLMNLIAAHRQVYELTKHNRRHKVSMAHHVLYFYPGDDSRWSRLSAWAADLVANRFTLWRVKSKSDFLALNYYFAHRVVGFKVEDPLEEVNDLGWDMQPQYLQAVLETLYKRYRLPIMITENGLADAEDDKRKWWLTESVKAMNAALANKVRLVGYLHWSLLDNFEWDKGFWPKFGLISVNRRTMERTVRPSAKWFGGVIRRLKK